MFDTYLNLYDYYKTLPNCMEFDAESCEYDNGDTIYCDNCYPMRNGYVIELAWYDSESEMTWDGIALLVEQGHIYEVAYFAIDVDENGNEYVDECHVNNEHMIGTPLYMDALDEWKAYYLACSKWF